MCEPVSLAIAMGGMGLASGLMSARQQAKAEGAAEDTKRRQQIEMIRQMNMSNADSNLEARDKYDQAQQQLTEINPMMFTGDARRHDVFLLSSAPVPVNIIGCGWEGNYLRRSSGLHLWVLEAPHQAGSRRWLDDNRGHRASPVEARLGEL